MRSDTPALQTCSPYVREATILASQTSAPPLKRLSLDDTAQDIECCLAHQVDVAVTYLRRALEEAIRNSRICPEKYKEALETFNNIHNDEFPTLAFVEDQMRFVE